MTSNSSSTNRNDKTTKKTNKKAQGSFLMHNLRSYWWIAVICSVVYGFAGPVFTMLRLDNLNVIYQVNNFTTEEAFLQQQMESIARWFRAEGFMPLYFSAIVLAACIGCVMFFYLQKKKQVNFYHSQPITRTRLFVNQYVAGLVLNIVSLIVMTVLSFVVVAAYGVGGIIDTGVVAQHLLYMILLLLASYSIAVFAGQLAGNMAIQMVLNAVLHFGVPIAAWLVMMLCDLFFATYNGAGTWMEASLNFSPVCAAFMYLTSIDYRTGLTTITTDPMDGGMLAVLIGITLVLTAVSWVLYQKRPSEATGKSLVYPITEPIVKAYMMFVVAIAAGLVFQAVASKFFFYFAIVAFGILTHMTCEVIIQHDFKAMVKRMKHCAVIIVLILAIVGVFRFDVLGYDSYLPEPDKVQQVSLRVNGVENLNYSDQQFSANTEVKQGVYDLLYPIVTERRYRMNDFAQNVLSSEPYDVNGGRNTSITVHYVMMNGETKTRLYQAVPAAVIEETYAALYNQQGYREAIYHDVLNATPQTLESMSIDNTQIYNKDWYIDQSIVEDVLVQQKGEITVTTVPAAIETVDKNSRYANKDFDYQDMVSILENYKLDVMDRQADVLTTAYPYRMELMLPGKDGRGSYYFDAPIYESDKRTMALLEQMNIEEDTRNYSDALIFRCEPSTEAELRQMLDTAINNLAEEKQRDMDNLTVERCIEVLSDEAELVDHISGVDNVNQFIRETGLAHSSGIFVEYDNTHFALMRYNNPEYNDWNNQLFYKGTVPAQYQ